MEDRTSSARPLASVSGLPGPVWGSERRNVLDRAHRGDIEGALGRLAAHQPRVGHRGRRRLATFLIIMGPGLVVMAADNDAGSISTFAQAGQDYGLRWVWLPVVLAGILFVMQEMAARLGVVTGTGHARLIFERFGRGWGLFALGDLIALDVLTIVTEFIGLQFGLGYFGVSRFVAVPVAMAALLALGTAGSFRRWEQVALTLVLVSLLAAPLLLLLQAHRSVASRVGGSAGHSLIGLASRHPVSGQGLLFALALVGTTVAPWQLFFQQANVVDKRITTRWLGYERTDTLVGTVVFAIGATAVVAGCAALLGGSLLHGRFVDAGDVASALRMRGGSWAGTLFALGLIDGSLLGAGVVSLATGYAVGEVAGTRHSLHRGWHDARIFHGVQAGCIALGAAIVLIAEHDLGFITLAVQALSGVLFPSAAVLLLLLCNDREVLGPWVNRLFHNCVAGLLVGVLLVLSALLSVKTAFPHLGAQGMIGVVGAVLGAGAAIIVLFARGGSHAPKPEPAPVMDSDYREGWSMPPLEELPPPRPSRARSAGLAVLRVYVSFSVLALAVVVFRAISGA